MSEILGVPQTLAAFARLSIEAEAGEKIAEVAGAEVVAADMREKAPVRTGALRSSIVVRPLDEGVAAAALVPYARFVEFGTRYMEAQPFMQQAAEDTGHPVTSAMTAAFKRILR